MSCSGLTENCLMWLGTKPEVHQRLGDVAPSVVEDLAGCARLGPEVAGHHDRRPGFEPVGRGARGAEHEDERGKEGGGVTVHMSVP